MGGTIRNGNPLPPVNPRETAPFVISNGDHNFHVDLVGLNADLWAPTAQDLPMTITAGRSSRLTPTFNRKGILNITLSDPKVVDDFLVVWCAGGR